MMFPFDFGFIPSTLGDDGDPHDSQDQFTETQVNVGKSLVSDQRTKAKTSVPERQGDRGDEKRN